MDVKSRRHSRFRPDLNPGTKRIPPGRVKEESQKQKATVSQPPRSSRDSSKEMESSTSLTEQKVRKVRNAYGPPSESPSGVITRTRSDGSATVQQRLAFTPQGTNKVWHDTTPRIESSEEKCARKQRNKSSTQAARRKRIATDNPAVHDAALEERRKRERSAYAGIDPEVHETTLEARRAVFADVDPAVHETTLEARRAVFADVDPAVHETALKARRAAYVNVDPAVHEAALEERRERERLAYAAMPSDRRAAQLEIRRRRRPDRQVRHIFPFPR